MSDTSAAIEDRNTVQPISDQQKAPEASAPYLPQTGPLWRLLGPVQRHLVGCSLLSALGAAAGLAPYIESAVQTALAELAAGKTVLVIAHRLHTIAGANQILVLEAGQVAERGTHEDLIARAGIYRAQQDGARA